MSLRLISILISLLIIVTVSARDLITISGRVTTIDGSPVEAAIVRLDSTDTLSRTDSIGRYSIRVPAGQVSLSVSMTGFNPISRTFTLFSSSTVNFQLAPVNALFEVTAYGKTKLRQLRESEFSVNSVDVAAAVNTTATLSDLVGRTAGVRIRTTGGLGSDFDVTLNGLTGSAIRYFIDGIPMESRGSDVSLDNLPLNQIERIDIYKGVVPAFLGTDAMGGAINIITRAQKRRYIDASVSAGSFHTFKADFAAQTVEPNTGLIIRPTFNYGYSKNDYMMRNVEVWDKDADRYITTDRRRFHDDYRSIMGQIEAGFENKSWARSLFISASYTDLDKEIQTGSVQAIVYGTPRRLSHAWSLGARYVKDNLFLRGLTLNLSLSHTWDRSQTVDTVYRKYDWNGNWIPTQRNEITGGTRSIRHYLRPLTVVRANLNYRFADIHVLDMNYSLNRTGNKRYDDLDPEYDPAKDILGKHIIGLSYSHSLLDERLQNTIFGKSYIEQLRIVQLSDKWSDNARESSTKTFWGYGIGSRYNIIDPLQVKFSFEHSVRLPLSREMLGNGTTVSANLSLKPENSDNLNLGIFGNLRLGNNHSFYYEIAGYLRHVKDMIHLVTNENTGLSVYGNISSVNVRGIEGELGYHFADKLHLTTNWSYSVSRDMNARRSDGKPSVTYKNRIPNRPWLYGNTELTYLHHGLIMPHDKVRAGYVYQYVHWFYLTWEGYGSLSSKSKIPTQNQQNIYITYSWLDERYNATLEVDNIFDRILYDNYKLQKPGRSIMAKFRIFLQ